MRQAPVSKRTLQGLAVLFMLSGTVACHAAPETETVSRAGLVVVVAAALAYGVLQVWGSWKSPKD